MADASDSIEVKSGDSAVKSAMAAQSASKDTSSMTGVPHRPKPKSNNSYRSMTAPDSLLSGKQEHCQLSRARIQLRQLTLTDLKRELIAQQVAFEISELSSPTALQRFGAPFRSEYGEVAPVDSELPILRYIFVHHVRNFPFLDQAKEKEFWQDKLQVVRCCTKQYCSRWIWKFLELFANKHISSSEDRLEETKRRKLALKARKLVELMMVSGIPTASGYEERIKFSEMEVVERGANEQGLLVNEPEGHFINGWDVNVAGVRTTSIKRTVRYHTHAVRTCTTLWYRKLCSIFDRNLFSG
jgi:PX-associated